MIRLQSFALCTYLIRLTFLALIYRAGRIVQCNIFVSQRVVLRSLPHNTRRFLKNESADMSFQLFSVQIQLRYVTVDG